MILNANWNLNVFLFYILAVRFGRVPKREKAKIMAAMQSSRMKTQESKVMSEMTDDAKIIETIVRAHYDTCDYTMKKMEPFLQKAKLNPQYVNCTGAVSSFVFCKYFILLNYPNQTKCALPKTVHFSSRC